MANWFLVRGGKEQGPYTSQQLKQAASTGQLKPDDLVRREDSKAAVAAKSIQGLFSKSPPPLPPQPLGTSPPTPPPPVATPRPVAPPSTAAPAAKSNGMIKIALLVGGIGATLAFLCCGGLVVMGVVTQQSITAKVREADAKWFAGEKAAAVADYRALAANHPASLGDRLPTIYGRIIDFQFESGEVELGKKVIAEARSKSVVPSVESELAKQAMKAMPVIVAAPDEGSTVAKKDVGYSSKNDFAEIERELEAFASTQAQAINDSDVVYDFSKDESHVPSGAKSTTRSRVISDKQSNVFGKYVEEEGYELGDSTFVAQGAFNVWENNQKQTKIISGRKRAGELHGITIEWHSNGQKLSETPYVKGEVHGTMKMWHANGREEYVANYLDGRFHGRRQGWYDNGAAEFDEWWKAGKAHGLHKRWWNSGNPQFIGYFQNDVPHIQVCAWNEDGSPRVSGKWNAGVPIGKHRLAFRSADQEWYSVDADDRKWQGGSIEEFIAKMAYFSACDHPNVQIQFDPRSRLGLCDMKSQDLFFSRFGRPSSDVLDVEKAPDFKLVADQYRLWTYSCTNGSLRLHVQPTQSNTLLITVER